VIKKDKKITKTDFSQEDVLDIQFTAEELITNKETDNFRTKNISKLLNKLPKRQKEAIYLKYYSGLKATEIAEIMNINYQSVVNILYKALKNLKEEVSILNLFK
jgi:RNA polymerase sigma factor (sigma-70 family)